MTSKTLPVLWGSNPIRLYVMGNEFGATHVILAENESEAWEEWADTQEPCDHGADPDVLAAVARGDDEIGCDCRMREDGAYVWDVYTWQRSYGTLDHFLGALMWGSVPR